MRRSVDMLLWEEVSRGDGIAALELGEAGVEGGIGVCLLLERDGGEDFFLLYIRSSFSRFEKLDGLLEYFVDRVTWKYISELMALAFPNLFWAALSSWIVYL